MNDIPNETNYRWYILFLATLTFSLTTAVPTMCMSVLFDEISDELGLSLTEVGLVWGIGALPGIVVVLFGGVIGDRFGPKRVLTLVCLSAGLAGALRGLSNGFLMLAATGFLYGLMSSMVPMSVFKTSGTWFSRQQLGLANGIISMGMALGFMASSMISATVLSPWLGGWRNVLIFYGILAMTLSIPWYFARSAPPGVELSAGKTTCPQSLRQTMAYVLRIKNLWLLGWAIMGIGGCVQGTLGYLPQYLKDQGWPGATADGALATFHTASMLLVIPIALWSDKLGSRKRVLLVAALMIATGVGLLSVVDGVLVWFAVILAGMVRDGFMAIFMTMVVETEGVGAAYAGTATGLIMAFSGSGNLLAPPLGNSLARITPGLPFGFWMVLALAGLVGLYMTKDRGTEIVLAVQPSGR
jgi:NNP family nitrate/nitrite transporter-like MFS transporter